MRKLLAVIVSVCLSSLAIAQQDPQFSQNMFNRLFVNPAAAGANDAICASLLYRNQWVGFDGSPKSVVAGVDAPIANERIGVGLTILSDQIGFEKTLMAKLAGAYRMNVGSGKLSVGVDFDILQHELDGEFRAPDGGAPGSDPAIPSGGVNGNTFDMGAGIYYQSDKWYAGFSSTHILEGSVDLDKFSKEFNRHFYGMLGYTFEVSPSVQLKPMVFVKNVTGNTTIDVNVNAHFNNRFWGGISWRNEDAFVVMAGLNIIENLKLGYSYDFTTSELRDYSDGTHEIMLGYCFNVKKRVPVSIKNVRFL